MYKICLFAGTSDGRRLAKRLAGRGAALTVCVATDYGGALIEPCDGLCVRVGRMDEAEMAAFFAEQGFDIVIDATHPYADRATQNIAQACRDANVEYLRALRASTADSSDGVCVPDSAACAEFLKTVSGSVLLTTGSKELPAFCGDEALRERLYVRVLPMQASLEICASCGIRPERIIAMQGPFDEEMNYALLRAVRAKWLVTKDTGDAGGYAAKIHAAERAGVRTVIIGRPAQVDGMAWEDAAAYVEARYSLQAPKKRVALVGIGMGGEEMRTAGMLRAVREADCVIGAKRMLDSIECADKIRYEAIYTDDIVRFIREAKGLQRFAVLFSGDTGFYSGATKLEQALGDVEMEVLPGIGSLQYFCARLRRPWENVRAVSLHGRDCNFIAEVRAHEAVFALLGGPTGAVDALERLCRAGLGELTVHVGQKLGYPNERIASGSAQSLCGESFDPLSVIFVENPAAGARIVTHGLPDEAFERDDVPMTKSEVRGVSLSKLALTSDSIVYDVGSGSGSVAVECALQATRGWVYAIERKPQAAALTRRNAERFGLENLTVVEGYAPQAFEELPAPTHAFIGGSAGNLAQIVDEILEKNPNARIVANAVTLETIAELTELAKRFGECDIVQIAASRPRKVGSYHLMTAQNPVYIFTFCHPIKAE